LNQPLVVDSSGTAYSYLFGPRFAFLRGGRISPFVQVMGGGVHASQVTVTNCSGAACTPLPAQNTFSMTAGGGLDIRLSRHFVLRAVQGEYMLTRFASSSAAANSNQNDYRVSSGLVCQFGGAPVYVPVQLACAVQPQSVFPGEAVTVTATATNLSLKHPATYTWTTSGGTVSGSGPSASIRTTGMAAGTYSLSGTVTQNVRPDRKAECSVPFVVKAFDPPTISCIADPASVGAGGVSMITATALSLQNRVLTFSYSATAGQIASSTPTAALSTSGAAPGGVTVTCSVVDDLGKTASATTIVSIIAPPMTAVAETRALCAISFERDRKRPTRVNNEAKACLDEVAVQMQRESTGTLVIVGDYSADETPQAGAQRSRNARQYLTSDKGIDSQRIVLRVGAADGRTVKDIFVPPGATFAAEDTTLVDWQK